LAPGALNSIFKQAGLKYLIIIEQTDSGCSAYLPDLPGCVTTGQTKEKTEMNMKEAI